MRNYFDKKWIYFIILCMEINVIKSRFMRGVFEQNTYVLLSKKQALIIDAGADLEDVKQAVGNRKVQAILMTHLHFDHFWYLEEYLKEFECPVYIQEGAENKFTDSELNGAILVRKTIIKNIDKSQIKYYENRLKLGNFDCDIIKTPGHTADSVCILINDNLFTGDTIFLDTIGRIDLGDSSRQDMINSLRKIQELDFVTAYPGHYESASKNQIIKTIGFYL